MQQTCWGMGHWAQAQRRELGRTACRSSQSLVILVQQQAQSELYVSLHLLQMWNPAVHWGSNGQSSAQVKHHHWEHPRPTVSQGGMA